MSGNHPVLTVDWEKLTGVDKDQVSRYLPTYLTHPTPVSYGVLGRLWFFVSRIFLELGVWVFLRPRTGKVGNLSQEEVDLVYSKEALTYDRKHHFTTHGEDLVWRRQAAWFVRALSRRQPNSKLKVLDLCTGTGLVIKAMQEILPRWSLAAEIVGLDFSVNMEDQARKNVCAENVRIAWGDATNLVETEDRPPTKPGMERFLPNTFGATTQMCGIGGIPEPVRQFDGLLQVLEESGQFFMSDIHKPIPELAGEWPCLFWWLSFPRFEVFAYEKITLPLVLSRLWGWRDPTAYFYLLPLTVHQSADGQWWGFEVVTLSVQSQRWWLSLPLMPNAQIVVEKARIDPETAEFRQRLLAAIRVC
jgi:hypothetical protein